MKSCATGYLISITEYLLTGDYYSSIEVTLAMLTL